jgi:hypothetical protein
MVKKAPISNLEVKKIKSGKVFMMSLRDETWTLINAIKIRKKSNNFWSVLLLTSRQ